MKFSALVTAFAAASVAMAAPMEVSKRADAPTDIQVLQYALTLEHLENAFYHDALAKFTADDFKNAGFPDWVRGRISQIAEHEASHVKLLSAALGAAAVKPCAYAFPYTEPKGFVALAYAIENIGVSAYAGANQYITDPLYKTVAASILSQEARHNGFLGGPVLTMDDWTGPYDTPLGLDMVYTLAAQLITSCPSDNAALPVKSYGPLTSGGLPILAGKSGDTLKLDYKGQAAGQNAVIYNGLGSTIVPITADGKVVLPAGLQGFSYIVITTATDATKVDGTNIVAGPAELQSFFGFVPSNPGFMNPFGA